ncbi:hypothetical protein V6K52_06945 [Knoellia sp. S7-12]|uniref:hypothetical protein n=1 Tax=Knoellia sp. S7-12 TaxID=3126698 RepID=UPI0033676BD9
MGLENEFAVAEGELRGAQRQMDKAMGSYLREVSEMREALHQFRLEVEEEREDPRAQAQEKEMEQDIRAGKHGEGLKELQQRIDLDQTTLADVLSGRDGHRSADALRDIFGDRVDAALADGETKPDPVREESRNDPGATGRPGPLHEGGTW